MKTVRVRIAVVVDADGKWSAAGWSNEDGTTPKDLVLMDAALDTSTIDEAVNHVFVEADVPIPEVPDHYDGEVKPGEKPDADTPLRSAIRDILVMTSNREAFVAQGPYALARIERALKAALEQSERA